MRHQMVIPVTKSLLNAFIDVAKKRHLRPEDIEREALVTYLRSVGQTLGYDSYDGERHERYRLASKKILADLCEAKRIAGNGNRYEA